MKQKPFVLLVEDDPELRRVIALNLSKRGYIVLESGSFQQAIDQMAIRPQMIILDIGLPDASGWEVADWARTVAGSTPIVVISAYDPDRRRMERVGPVKFLHKPFAIRQLVDCVESLT